MRTTWHIPVRVLKCFIKLNDEINEFVNNKTTIILKIYRHLYIFTAIVKYLIRVKYRSKCCVTIETFQAKKI